MTETLEALADKLFGELDDATRTQACAALEGAIANHDSFDPDAVAQAVLSEPWLDKTDIAGLSADEMQKAAAAQVDTVMGHLDPLDLAEMKKPVVGEATAKLATARAPKDEGVQR